MNVTFENLKSKKRWFKCGRITYCILTSEEINEVVTKTGSISNYPEINITDPLIIKHEKTYNEKLEENTVIAIARTELEPGTQETTNYLFFRRVNA